MNNYEDFWENRSNSKNQYIHSISNLCNNEEFARLKNKFEKDKIIKLFETLNRQFNSCIDIGAGTCQWTDILINYSKRILETDTSRKMLLLGKENNLKIEKTSKISYFFGDITTKQNPENSPYDLIFLSGLLLYLDKIKYKNLMRFISDNISIGTLIILREPVGLNGKYIINNEYSKELKCNYSAIYRTEKDIIHTMNKLNLKQTFSQWMHEDGSKFNKWKETRLKLMVFEKY